MNFRRWLAVVVLTFVTPTVFPQIPGPQAQPKITLAQLRTPQSLYERNIEFYRLAHKHGIASYDGMDVRPVGVPTKQ